MCCHTHSKYYTASNTVPLQHRNHVCCDGRNVCGLKYMYIYICYSELTVASSYL